MPTHWQLFIDESGNFDDPGDTRVVAGLLVASAYHPDQVGALRTALQRAIPGVPYPPHASELNVGAGRVAAVALAANGAGATPEPAVWAALEALRGGRAPALREFLRCIDLGRRPPRDTTLECDQWLEDRAPAVQRALRELRHRDSRSMKGLLGSIARHFGTTGSFVVGASVSTSPGEDGYLTGVVFRDTYLRTLSALFERVFSLLRSSRNESHQVWVRAATRNVERSAKVSLPMRLEDLGAAIQEAAVLPFHAASAFGSGTARIVPAACPERYDAGVHPGIVLADFISNRLRWHVRSSARRSWRALADAAATTFSLPLEALAREYADAGPLPALAVEGPTRLAVNAAFRGEIAALPENSTRWDRDQALSWIGAIQAGSERRGPER